MGTDKNIKLHIVTDIKTTTTMAKKVLNFNTITEKELELLPGIGKVKAAALVQHRTLHSHYSSIKDVRSVEGITNTLIAKLQEDYYFRFSPLCNKDAGKQTKKRTLK